jgi:hypothetical protein
MKGTKERVAFAAVNFGIGTRRTREPVTKVYQLKVSLDHIRPATWRRILVAGDINLNGLHRVIQSARGWQDCHLHLFRVGDADYPDPDMEVDGARSEFAARLFRIAPKVGGSFMYEYDFGDNWTHTITVEAVSENDARYPGHPVCISGENACPPEDGGGVPGYMRLRRRKG